MKRWLYLHLTYAGRYENAAAKRYAKGPGAMPTADEVRRILETSRIIPVKRIERLDD